MHGTLLSFPKRLVNGGCDTDRALGCMSRPLATRALILDELHILRGVLVVDGVPRHYHTSGGYHDRAHAPIPVVQDVQVRLEHMARDRRVGAVRLRRWSGGPRTRCRRILQGNGSVDRLSGCIRQMHSHVGGDPWRDWEGVDTDRERLQWDPERRSGLVVVASWGDRDVVRGSVERMNQGS